MKTSSWVILVVAGALTLVGSLFSLGIAYFSVTLVVSVLILLRVPFLGISLGAPSAVTGAGTHLRLSFSWEWKDSAWL